MHRPDLPDVLLVGPVAARTFADDGRLVIDYGTVPPWSAEATLPDLVARAKLLALLLDALDPAIDIRVGARHEFLLDAHIDERVDTRGGVTPPRLLAYGALVTRKITVSELRRRVDVRNEPSSALGLFASPLDTDIVSQLRPGAALTRNSDAGYFDQIVSFETAEDASPSRRTTKALRRWSRAVDAWHRKAAPEQRDLERPWT